MVWVALRYSNALRAGERDSHRFLGRQSTTIPTRVHAELNTLPDEVIRHALNQGRQIYTKGGQAEGGKLVWAALLRKLDREDPGYAS